MRTSLLRASGALAAAGTLILLGPAAAGAAGQPAATITSAGIAQVTASGPVWAWGLNSTGQLGDGTTISSDLPVKVKLPAGTKVTAVSAGRRHSLALTSTGQVLAWGGNLHGELGDGTTTSSDIPVPVKLPHGVKVIAIAAGDTFNLALTSAGRVLAWGWNAFGQLGNGTTATSDVPVRVMLPAGAKVTAVSAGGGFSLALTSTGRVLAWGRNREGQLGIGVTRHRHHPVPVLLPRDTRVTAIAAGQIHSLALTAAGRVLAWGNNSIGQLGNGTTKSSDIPVAVKLRRFIRVTAIASGGYHGLALTTTGHILGWGNNADGELACRRPCGTSDNVIPLRMKLPAGTKVTAIAAGFFHSLVLTRAGHILACGANFDGELGDGTNTDSRVLVRARLAPGLFAAAVARGPNAKQSLVIVHHTG